MAGESSTSSGFAFPPTRTTPSKDPRVPTKSQGSTSRSSSKSNTIHEDVFLGKSCMHGIYILYTCMSYEWYRRQSRTFDESQNKNFANDSHNSLLPNGQRFRMTSISKIYRSRGWNQSESDRNPINTFFLALESEDCCCYVGHGWQCLLHDFKIMLSLLGIAYQF
jgi:hypothetical protein